VADLHGRVVWPGVRSPTFATYSMGHGVAPGTAVVRCNPQATPISPDGDLLLTDGASAALIPGCRVDRITETRDAGGTQWELLISDGRWRWRDAHPVSGYYNQLDPHAKYVPWTVRSPREIAELCLKAMGVTTYQIDMPAGLTRGMAAGLKEFLPAGVNFPVVGVNPPVDWVYERAALVLEAVAEMFGRRVVWRWADGAVWVVQKGTGTRQLPGGSVASVSPAWDNPATPDAVEAVGSPTRYQVDLELQALGEEFDGTYKPLAALSYAPLSRGARHKVRVTGEWANVPPGAWRYLVSLGQTADIDGGADWDLQASAHSNDYPSIADVLIALAAQINNAAAAAEHVTATVVGDDLVVEAKQMGPSFNCTAFLSADGMTPDDAGPRPPWDAKILVQGRVPTASWDRSPPPLFPGVRATPRLTLKQARELAQRSVWRVYGLSGRDIKGKGPIEVPGYGPVNRRQQIVLLDTQCEQVVPEAPDFNVRLRNGDPFVANLYNGYSRDKPAAVFGAVSKRLTAGSVYYLSGGTTLNTSPREQVQVDFSVDNTWQVIKFSAPVYRTGKGATYQEPHLRLRTAVNVRDPETNQLVAYSYRVRVPGRPADSKTVVSRVYPDVQLNAVPTYREVQIGDAELYERLLFVKELERDPIDRARYYAAGLLAQYTPRAGDHRVYNGVFGLQLDGSLSQITWTFGPRGCSTAVSLNGEHNTSVPPYPARRRAELLRAACDPTGFLGKMVGRSDPTRPAPYRGKPAS